MPLWLCHDLSGRLFECDCFRYWHPLLMAMTPTRTIIAIWPCHPIQLSVRLPSTSYRRPRCICQRRLATTQISTAAGNMLQMVRKHVISICAYAINYYHDLIHSFGICNHAMTGAVVHSLNCIFSKHINPKNVKSWHHVQRQGQRSSAQLAPPSSRLSWSLVHGLRQRHSRQETLRTTTERSGRPKAGQHIRSLPPHGF